MESTGTDLRLDSATWKIKKYYILLNHQLFFPPGFRADESLLKLMLPPTGYMWSVHSNTQSLCKIKPFKSVLRINSDF